MGSHLGILRLLEKYSDLAKKGSVGLPKIFFFQKKKYSLISVGSVYCVSLRWGSFNSTYMFGWGARVFGQRVSTNFDRYKKIF